MAVVVHGEAGLGVSDHDHKVAPLRIVYKGKPLTVIACPICLVDIDGREWK